MNPVPTPFPCWTLPNGPGWKTSVVTFTTAGSAWRTTAATGSAPPFGAPPGGAPTELADRAVRSTEQAEATIAIPTMPSRILRMADPRRVPADTFPYGASGGAVRRTARRDHAARR